MANLIGILSRGTESVPAVIESKTIISNGTYAAPEGIDGYNPVIVQVPERQPITARLEVTENGTYTPGGSVDGYKPVVVNVPQQAARIEPKSIIANGIYAAPEGVDGYSPVNVNVPIPIRERGLSYQAYKEVDMNFNNNNFYGDFNILWTNGSSIGFSLNGKSNVSNYEKVIVKGKIGDSYQRKNQTSIERFNFFIGFTDIIFSQVINVGFNTGTHLIDSAFVDVKDNYNLDFELELNIPDSECYFFISAPGINATNVEVQFE